MLLNGERPRIKRDTEEGNIRQVAGPSLANWVTQQHVSLQRILGWQRGPATAGTGTGTTWMQQVQTGPLKGRHQSIWHASPVGTWLHDSWDGKPNPTPHSRPPLLQPVYQPSRCESLLC